MKSLFDMIFPTRPALIGMIHVWPGELKAQIDQALEDVERMAGFNAFIVENYSWGYADRNHASEATAVRIGRILSTVVRHANVPVGVNILPNDYEQALHMAHKSQGAFIQLDHVTGDFWGAVSVDPQHLLDCRQKYAGIAVFGGIQPKYYRLRTHEPIEVAALRAMALTDALVVTGTKTGGETSVRDLTSVRRVIGDHPVIVGSGFSADNATVQLSNADGAIVGTAVKRGGVVKGEPVDRTMVERLLSAVDMTRG